MRSNATMPNPVRGAERTARNAANSRVMRSLARLGYGVYSFVEARYRRLGPV